MRNEALHVAVQATFLAMKQPGLDGRHRDVNGKISVKHGNTLNMHLSPSIPGFGPLATLSYMRAVTGKFSESDVRWTARLMQLRNKKFTIEEVRAAAARVRAKRELARQRTHTVLMAGLRRLAAKHVHKRALSVG